MLCGEDGLPFVLLVQLSSRPSTLCKWGGVHEPAQVEVLLKVGHTVFHLVVVKIRFHVRDLNICLVPKKKKKVSNEQLVKSELRLENVDPNTIHSMK